MMGYFVRIFLCLVGLVISPLSSASLITYNTDNNLNYITYQSDEHGTFDLTWASSYNVQFVGQGCLFLDLDPNESYLDTIHPDVNNPFGCNQLLAPTQPNGFDDWAFYSDLNTDITLNTLLEVIYKELYGDVAIQNMVSNIFNYESVQFNSFSIWNTKLLNGGSITDESRMSATSDWTQNGLMSLSAGPDVVSTIYFRQATAQPVPEPSSLMLFALVLFGFVARKKIANK